MNAKITTFQKLNTFLPILTFVAVIIAGVAHLMDKQNSNDITNAVQTQQYISLKEQIVLNQELFQTEVAGLNFRLDRIENNMPKRKNYD